MAKDISLPINKLSKKTLLYVIMNLTKTKKKFVYQIENQIQCSHTAILRHIIFYSTVPVVQYPFQLYLSKSPFFLLLLLLLLMIT